MPDISMCGAVGCPISSTCHRHADSGTQPNEPWQTYSAFAYGMKGCVDYWPKPGGVPHVTSDGSASPAARQGGEG